MGAGRQRPMLPPSPGALPAVPDMLCMSSPAQKALPSPDSTTARRSGSRAALAGLDQRGEHGRVQRVHLVGTVQAHLGHAVSMVSAMRWLLASLIYGSLLAYRF